VLFSFHGVHSEVRVEGVHSVMRVEGVHSEVRVEEVHSEGFNCHIDCKNTIALNTKSSHNI